MAAASLALKFLLELCALAALAFWGATADIGGAAANVALAIAAPLTAAAIWNGPDLSSWAGYAGSTSGRALRAMTRDTGGC